MAFVKDQTNELNKNQSRISTIFGNVSDNELVKSSVHYLHHYVVCVASFVHVLIRPNNLAGYSVSGLMPNILLVATLLEQLDRNQRVVHNLSFYKIGFIRFYFIGFSSIFVKTISTVVSVKQIEYRKAVKFSLLHISFQMHRFVDFQYEC